MRPQVVADISKPAMFDVAVAAVKHQQAAAVAALPGFAQ